MQRFKRTTKGQQCALPKHAQHGLHVRLLAPTARILRQYFVNSRRGKRQGSCRLQANGRGGPLLGLSTLGCAPFGEPRRKFEPSDRSSSFRAGHSATNLASRMWRLLECRLPGLHLNGARIEGRPWRHRGRKSIRVGGGGVAS
jgi:hypothetical protein